MGGKWFKMEQKNVLITGGGGFLGQVISKKCVERGDRVWSFSRRNHSNLSGMGVTQIQGDVADENAINKACEGKDLVFHLAARMGLWGRFSTYYKTNVKGTRNVIAACKMAGVPVLVYTSSTSVIMDNTGHYLPIGGRYPEKFGSNYAMSKAFAEQAVIRAADQDLRCAILRPHMIWGPGDMSGGPSFLRERRWIVKIGNGMNSVSGIYIDNAAHAHLLAADKVALDPSLSGKTFFLAQDDPFLLWDFIERIQQWSGQKRIIGAIPYTVAMNISGMMEWVYKSSCIKSTPFLTRNLVGELSGFHVFDTKALNNELGFSPEISVDTGLEIYQKWLKKEYPAMGKRGAA